MLQVIFQFLVKFDEGNLLQNDLYQRQLSKISPLI